jgi:hypothetical protein
MKVKQINLASISDIHLGNTRNRAPEIIANLRDAIRDDAETSQLDIIFLAGDVFDNLLLLPDEEVLEIDLWISSVLRICGKYSIKLRILEGTPRHDWRQSKRFEILNEVMDKPADLKYFTTISIEHIEDLGIDVLYVPDEATPSPEQTLKVVRELMQSKGLEKVDFACMHGAFEYQIPMISRDHKHDSAAYLDLVRYLITIGHVHQFSQLDRIVAQGSFDRLTHGQEEKKGFIKATVYQSGEWEVTFIENKGAKKFVTLKCPQDTLEETLLEIDLLVKTLPYGSYIRLDLNRGHPLLASNDPLIRRYPGIVWEKIVRSTQEEDEIVEVVDDDSYTPIAIHADNIVGLLMNRIELDDALSQAVVDRSQELLRSLVNEGGK